MAPFEKPLGKDVQPFPEVEGDRSFRGYELDEEGNPTFLFSESGRTVREHFKVSEGTLQRILTWEKGSAPKVVHPKGVEAKETKEGNKLTVIYRWK